MILFRTLLVAMFLGIVTYTGIVAGQYGWDLLTPFFGGILSLTWPGQFHYDFTCYLVLSGLWIAWREKFSARGILLGAIASVLGILFFAPYLLWLSFSKETPFPK